MRKVTSPRSVTAPAGRGLILAGLVDREVGPLGDGGGRPRKLVGTRGRVEAGRGPGGKGGWVDEDEESVSICTEEEETPGEECSRWSDVSTIDEDALDAEVEESVLSVEEEDEDDE